MRFREIQPKVERITADAKRVVDRAVVVAGTVNDKATKKAVDAQRAAMRAARLGKLANAVRSKTGRSRDRKGEPNSYGVIFAADGDESRAGGALEAYSRGTTIRPVRGPWLWYQTAALARTSKVGGSRGRLTPERYRQMGNPLGPLRFARISAGFAKLYVDVADVAVKTGRATRPGKGKPRTKVRTKRVTIFYGMKQTRRAQRYDPQRITAQVHAQIPAEIAAEMAADLRRG